MAQNQPVGQKPCSQFRDTMTHARELQRRLLELLEDSTVKSTVAGPYEHERTLYTPFLLPTVAEAMSTIL